MSSPAVSSHEDRQPVYLGPRFLDVSAWFAAVSQLMPGGDIELAPELWKAESINEATMGGKHKDVSNNDTQKTEEYSALFLTMLTHLQCCDCPLTWRTEKGKVKHRSCTSRLASPIGS